MIVRQLSILMYLPQPCKIKVKPLYRPKWPMGPVLNSSFLSMKRLGVLLLPPGWDASPLQGYPQHTFVGTHLYTWVKRSTVRVKCLA